MTNLKTVNAILFILLLSNSASHSSDSVSKEIPVNIYSVIKNNSIVREANQSIIFSFSEPVFGFEQTDIIVSGGSVEAFDVISDNKYSIDVVAKGGKVEVQLPKGSIVSVNNTQTSGGVFTFFYQDTVELVLGVDKGNDVTIKLIRIPAGSFLMGRSPNDNSYREQLTMLDETQFKATISQDYYIGISEVTQQQWKCLKDFPFSQEFSGDLLPVHNILRPEIDSWIMNINNKFIDSSFEFSLPTEAQWEYACRARTITRYSFGDAYGDNDFCSPEKIRTDNMWYCGNNSPRGPQNVMQKPSNGFGLYDMHGNIFEMVLDNYGDYPRQDTIDPLLVIEEPNKGYEYFVIRGDSWALFAYGCTASNRRIHGLTARDNNIGFRIAANVRN
jgi:formylglycine-generating enzyme required for sulfatase activity